jgi:hypothetical protein
MTRDGASGLSTSVRCETHFSGATQREESLLTPPVRIVVGRGVVGDSVFTTPVGFDRIDLGVVSIVSCIGYLLTRWRVGRVVVICIVVGDVELVPTADLDRIDLVVLSVVARKGYPITGR